MGEIVWARKARGGEWLKLPTLKRVGYWEGIRKKNLETVTREGETMIPGQGGDIKTPNEGWGFSRSEGIPLQRVKRFQPLNQETNTY